MRKKLVLDVDALSVDTFETGADAKKRGTVHAAMDACTCDDSCGCATSIFYCAEHYWTLYSCDYSADRSCVLTRDC